MEKVITVLISIENDEDRRIIFSAISTQDDIHITGVEKDEADAIIKSGQLKPDILIMGLRQNETDGTSLAHIIHRRSPDTAIIMISDRDENDYAEKAFKAGILGYLLIKTDMDILVHVVRIVKTGKCHLSTHIIKKLLASNFVNNGKKENCIFLSPVERCIISGIAMGISDEGIAKLINYSAGTVKNMVTAIKRKTKLKTRAEIAVFSLTNGLISPEQADFIKKKSDRQFLNFTIE